jgi:hypothetical protein
VRRIKSWKYTPEWRCVDEQQFRKLLAVARAAELLSKDWGDFDSKVRLCHALIRLNAPVKGKKK